MSKLASFVALWAALMCLPVAANEVLKWNDTAVKASAAGGQNAIQLTRTLAMVQAAVHDALNATRPRYAAYYFEGPAQPEGLPDAAVAGAARTVLLGVLPAFGGPAQKQAAQALVDEAYAAALAALPETPARAQGLAAGQAAGEAMLALRKDDGATRDAPYTPATGPGRWRPTPNPEPPNPPIRDPKAAPGLGAWAAEIGARVGADSG